MAAKKPATTKAADVASEPQPEPAAPVTIGATSGVMAPGAIGKAAREAAHRQWGNGGVIPEPTPDRPRDR
jgi:hypothetical protein